MEENWRKKTTIETKNNIIQINIKKGRLIKHEREDETIEPEEESLPKRRPVFHVANGFKSFFSLSYSFSPCVFLSLFSPTCSSR